MPFFDIDATQLGDYRPEIHQPDDFDDFWAATLAENPFSPASVRRERSESPLTTVDVWDLTFGGYGGDPIRAWLLLPAGNTGPLPMVVEFNGYNGGRGLPSDHLAWASAGFAHLFMDTRGQGAGWGTGGDTPDPHGSGPAAPGVMTKGIESPEQHYYRRAYVDAHHAVEVAATLPEVDPGAIVVQGASQGGALSIAAAALNPRVRAALPDVPFMCHLRRAVGLTDEFPYAEVVTYLSVYRTRTEEVFGTLSYFDCASLGMRAGMPALFSTALLDQTCPPSTVFAARNWWGALTPQRPAADIEVYPFNQHEGGQGYQWLKQVSWLRELLADDHGAGMR